MNHAHLITLNDNVLGAMDTETTGRDPYHNEVCQIAIVLLDCHLNPVDKFYSNIRPNHPERMHPQAVATHGLTVELLEKEPDIHQVTDNLWDWFQGLNLTPGKRIIPLCHNSQFDIPFVQYMLGHEMFNEIFGYPTRDTQSVAAGMNDAAAFKGLKLPFDRVGLGWLTEHFGIDLDDAHDALADALATARLYKALLNRH
jgi:DNA polymerase-3 subunit epsilon